MKVFKHKSHTAYEIRPWKVKEHGIVLIRETGNKKSIKTLFHNWKLYINKRFWIIRAPFFYFERNNGGIQIGIPNFYLWVIQ
jgi:hypothetical protein